MTMRKVLIAFPDHMLERIAITSTITGLSRAAIVRRAMAGSKRKPKMPYLVDAYLFGKPNLSFYQFIELSQMSNQSINSVRKLLRERGYRKVRGHRVETPYYTQHSRSESATKKTGTVKSREE